MRILGLTLIFTLLTIVVMHIGLGVLYPVSRTCLYLVPYFTISLLLSGYALPSGPIGRALKAAGLAMGSGTIVIYALSIHFSYFGYNAYDERSREMFLVIENDAKSRGLKTARIGGTWWYEPEIKYYSIRYKAHLTAQYDVVDASFPFQTPGRLRPEEYDYFIFTPCNAPDLGDRKTQILFHSDKSTTTIISILK